MELRKTNKKNSTRPSDAASMTNDAIITDLESARDFLTKRQLITTPLDESITLIEISDALNHLENSQLNIPLQVKNSIRALELVVRDMARGIDESLKEDIERSIKSSIDNLLETQESAAIEHRQETQSLLANDLHQSSESLKASMGSFLDKKMDESSGKLERDLLAATQAIEKAVEEKLTEKFRILQDKIESSAIQHAKSYKDALASSPPPLPRTRPSPPSSSYTWPLPATHGMDPRTEARIRNQQRRILLDGVKPSLASQALSSIAKVFNEAIKQLMEGAETLSSPLPKISSVVRLLRGNALILECSSSEAASKITSTEFAKKFLEKIDAGQGAAFVPRNYVVLARNVPISANLEDDESIKEVAELNNISDHSHLKKMKWVKPIARRDLNQLSAHAYITFLDPQTASEAIRDGLVIASRRVKTEKCKKEPVRCMKCQKFGHYAANCSQKDNVCGTCGNNHLTSSCSEKIVRKCASCSSTDHASWDKKCPTFLIKNKEYEERNPEVGMPYFPTDEPWTWQPSPTFSTNPKTSLKPPATGTNTQPLGSGQQRLEGYFGEAEKLLKEMRKQAEQAQEPEPGRTDETLSSSNFYD